MSVAKPSAVVAPEIVLQIRLDPAPLLEALRGSANSEISAEPETLLTQEEGARFCRCSVRHFRRLRDEGLPTLWLGESPRFERVAILAWLRARESTRPEPTGRARP